MCSCEPDFCESTWKLDSRASLHGERQKIKGPHDPGTPPIHVGFTVGTRNNESLYKVFGHSGSGHLGFFLGWVCFHIQSMVKTLDPSTRGQRSSCVRRLPNPGNASLCRRCVFMDACV